MRALAIFLRRMTVGVQTYALTSEAKEPMMHAFRPKSVQLDLFGPSHGSRVPDTPQWGSLPDRTRRRATLLMTRMLLEYRGNRAEAAEAGTGGESSDV